jgi:hypothetical protein
MKCFHVVLLMLSAVCMSTALAASLAKSPYITSSKRMKADQHFKKAVKKSVSKIGAKIKGGTGKVTVKANLPETQGSQGKLGSKKDISRVKKANLKKVETKNPGGGRATSTIANKWEGSQKKKHHARAHKTAVRIPSIRIDKQKAKSKRKSSSKSQTRSTASNGTDKFRPKFAYGRSGLCGDRCKSGVTCAKPLICARTGICTEIVSEGQGCASLCQTCAGRLICDFASNTCVKNNHQWGPMVTN